MGKTNLVPSLTYFTPAEYEERKSSAKRAGLSLSNFNRASMGYTAFKPGKPKKMIAPAEFSENSISFETVADAAERSGEFENSAVNSSENAIENAVENSTGNLKDLLLTDADVEAAFSNLLEMTETKSDDETASIDSAVETQPANQMPEPITENLTAKSTAKDREIERKDFISRNRNNSFDPNENLSQPNLFS